MIFEVIILRKETDSLLTLGILGLGRLHTPNPSIIDLSRTHIVVTWF